jgi:hypothetical protein
LLERQLSACDKSSMAFADLICDAGSNQQRQRRQSARSENRYVR